MSNSSTNSSIHSEEQLQHSTVPSFIISVDVINFLLGLPLNSYIIVLLLNRGRSLDPCDVFPLNQAAAEIFFMLCAPFHILLYVKSEMWYFQPLGFFLGIGMSVRSMLQCFVCLERYVAVSHPITFLKLRPLRYRVLMCIVTWMSGLPVGVTCMITFPYAPYKVFAVIYFIILSMNVFSCVSILNTLGHPGPGDRNTNRGIEDGAKKRAFQVVMINLLMFLSQNTPIAVVFAIQYSVPLTAFITATNICLAINLIMGLVQPVFVLRKAGKL